MAIPDVKSPLIFIYLASIPWGRLKIPATTCKSWNPSLPALDVLLHDSREVLDEVLSLQGSNPKKWQKEHSQLICSSFWMGRNDHWRLLKFSAPWKEEIGGNLLFLVITKV